MGYLSSWLSTRVHTEDSFWKHHRGDDGWKSVNGSLTNRADAKMSAKPVIMALQATEVKTFDATKFGLVNQTSGLCLTISTVIAAI